MEDSIAGDASPRVHFIHDFVELPVAWTLAARVLEARPIQLLAVLAEDATKEQEPFRLRVGLRPGGRVGTQVSVTLGEPIRQRDEVAIPIGWVAATNAWLFPRLDGLLGISQLAEGTSQLWLEGSYRTPFGLPGQLIDQALLGRVAQSTIRAFLISTASSIIDLIHKDS
ncbi:MAG: hypothetical protein ACYDHP_13055 [Ferrimicrobium sp.]